MTQPTIGEAFIEAVTTKYVTFSGRARRSELWCFYLAFLGLYGVAVVIDKAVGTVWDILLGVGWVSGLVELGLLLPCIAVTVRRLHDTGWSGWWLLPFFAFAPLAYNIPGLETLFVDFLVGLISLVPIATAEAISWIMVAVSVAPIIGLIVLMCIDSQPGDNAYGPNPKDQSGGAAPGAT